LRSCSAGIVLFLGKMDANLSDPVIRLVPFLSKIYPWFKEQGDIFTYPSLT